MNVLKKIINEVTPSKKLAYGATDTGIQRDSNQDSYLVLPDMGIYIVADGMGGHNAGEVASLSAVKAIGKYFNPKCVAEMKKGKRIKEKLTYAALMAHDRVLEASESNPEYAGMGSTLAISFNIRTYCILAT